MRMKSSVLAIVARAASEDRVTTESYDRCGWPPAWPAGTFDRWRTPGLELTASPVRWFGERRGTHHRRDMTTVNRIVRAVLVVCSAALPSTTLAQGSSGIAGAVRDSSGA